VKEETLKQMAAETLERDKLLPGLYAFRNDRQFQYLAEGQKRAADCPIVSARIQLANEFPIYLQLVERQRALV